MSPESGELERKKKILVVDDDPCINELAILIFKDAGYDTQSSADGMEALGAVATQKPDLILLDLRMPNMSGDEFYKRMKDKEETRDIPIVVVTASYSGDAALKKFIEDGVPVMGKPFDIPELLAVVTRNLNGKHQKGFDR